jgi:N-acetylglucosaminyl-diphospho-decaprenol L-rhamnosyltransferase
MLVAMPSPSLESIAVVTVTYNSSSHLGPFLESVRASENEELKIVVVDNNSADIDDTRRIADSQAATIIALDDNRGYGGAINRAFAALPPEIEAVLISNPDVSTKPGSIAELSRRLQSSTDIAAVGPRVLNADGTTYPSARNLPSLRTGVGHALFSGIWSDNPWSTSYRADSEGSDVERNVGWLSGSCLLVRRSAFESVGGFDEGYFMYFEDVDLGYRLGKAGWRNVYVPTAEVVHTGAHSTSAESSKMIQAHHDSAYRYLGKKYSGTYLAPLRWVLRAGLSVRSRYLSRKGSGHP